MNFCEAWKEMELGKKVRIKPHGSEIQQHATFKNCWVFSSNPNSPFEQISVDLLNRDWEVVE